jgi:hypothetical protein
MRAGPAVSLVAALVLAACASGCMTSRIRYDEEAPPPPSPPPAAGPAERERARFLAYTGGASAAGDLESSARLYRREDGAEVLLLAMVHFADAGFYSEVSRRIAGADVVLLEGTVGAAAPDASAPGDDDDGPALDAAAEIFGALDMVPQPARERIGPAGPRYVDGDVAPEELLGRVMAARRSGGAPQEFPATSFGWDRFWYRLFGMGERFCKAWRHAFASRLSPLDDEPVRAILIEPRNEALLARLDDELARRPAPRPGRAFRVVVPWGAEHMPGIERGLHARRFAAATADRIVAWRVRSYAAP